MRVLSTADLLAGDVLLSACAGMAGRLIRLLSGSPYSHAGIFDGAEVVELDLGGAGIVRRSATASCAASTLTHVYRFFSSGHQQLGKELPFHPIAALIERFINSRTVYGYSESLLIGVLLATRPNDVPEVAFVLRELLEEAAEQLSSEIQLGRCVTLPSELVYRCFLETQLAEYQVEVVAVDAAALPGAVNATASLMPSASAAHQSAGLKAMSLAFIRSYLRAKHVNDTKPSCRNAGAERAVPHFVTPGDLAASSNLVLAGVLRP